MDNAQNLVQRLKDNRSKRVVFLSHCILNENTRYLGGACRSCCVREIIEQCMNNDLGMIQMPCPEQHAWGGVTKRLLCIAYGSKRSLFYHLRYLILPLFLLYTKFIYRKLAREIAGQIKDYIVSGFSVIGVVGIDGSPSCGVNRTLDIWKSLKLTASVEVNSITSEEINLMIRENQIKGRGLFSSILQDEIKKRNISVPFIAHDLIAELNGNRSNVNILRTNL